MSLAVGKSQAGRGPVVAFSLRDDAPLACVTALYVGVVAWLAETTPFPMPALSSYLNVFKLYAPMAVLMVGCAFMVRLVKDRPDAPVSYAMDVMREWRMLERFKAGVPAILLITLFSAVCSAFKGAIPSLVPFHLDPLLAQMDAVLLGEDAWRLIQPLVGYPDVTYALNIAYNLWVPAFFLVLLVVSAWVERPRLRLQYLMTYVLCWTLLGSVLAVLLSSVGPCFYALFYGDDRYTGLADYLTGVDEIHPLAVLHAQQWLVSMQFESAGDYGKGISAMPSMHVSIATLFALLGWRVSRVWGVIATAFLAVIFIGSIHLGYHYAVDGLASLILTPVLWWAVGRGLDVLEARRGGVSDEADGAGAVWTWAGEGVRPSGRSPSQASGRMLPASGTAED